MGVPSRTKVGRDATSRVSAGVVPPASADAQQAAATEATRAAQEGAKIARTATPGKNQYQTSLAHYREPATACCIAIENAAGKRCST